MNIQLPSLWVGSLTLQKENETEIQIEIKSDINNSISLNYINRYGHDTTENNNNLYKTQQGDSFIYIYIERERERYI